MNELETTEAARAVPYDSRRFTLAAAVIRSGVMLRDIGRRMVKLRQPSQPLEGVGVEIAVLDLVKDPRDGMAIRAVALLVEIEDLAELDLHGEPVSALEVKKFTAGHTLTLTALGQLVAAEIMRAMGEGGAS